MEIEKWQTIFRGKKTLQTLQAVRRKDLIGYGWKFHYSGYHVEGWYLHTWEVA